jgi:hypothetical protein
VENKHSKHNDHGDHSQCGDRGDGRSRRHDARWADRRGSTGGGKTPVDQLAW